MRRFLILLALGLTACSTGGGGTVLPSPVGDFEMAQACRAAAPDIIPATPILADSVWFGNERGSAADTNERLRYGFSVASFTATPAHMAEANALPPKDSARWSQVPLGGEGTHSFEVAAFGDPRCTAFEREVEAQRGVGGQNANEDPMKYWTDPRFPPAPPEARNWCIAKLDSPDPNALRYTRTDTSNRTSGGTISIFVDTLTSADGAILARRTHIQMTRPSFPIGVSSVATGCDGRTIGRVPEFYGPDGIAFRAAKPATLVNR